MAAIHTRTKVLFARTSGGQFASGSQASIIRDEVGRFTNKIERKHRNVLEKGIERGARYSRRIAPRGRQRQRYAGRPGYVPLAQSIRTHISINGSQGYWYSIAPHAQFVEEGTAAHVIQGKMYFWWRGGFFFWDNDRYGPVGSGKPYENWTEAGGAWVYHPGTNAQPFLRPAYDKLRYGGLQEILREEFRR